ncbi:MAG: type II toxin-antitoxin system VapC family toxin, partial [Desulfohalobiaceae bacterium]
MKEGYLLDTNVFSELVKPEPNPGVTDKIERFEDRIATASIVWHELLYGYHRLGKSKKRDLLGEFLFEVLLPTVPILPYDDQAAEWHAHERARLSAIGQCPGFADGQIAAVSATNNLTLV